MLIHFLRSNSPSSYIILPLVAGLIWMLAFLEPTLQTDPHAMPLYDLSISLFLNHAWLGILFAFLLVVAQAFLLNQIVDEYEILTRKSFLPAFFSILLLSNSYLMLAWHPALPANLFLLFAIQRLLSSYRRDTAFSPAFDAGLLVSVASLFYLPYIAFLPLVAVGLILMRPFNWREWIIAGFGMLLPYVFTICFYFWRDELDQMFIEKILFNLKVAPSKTTLKPEFYLLLSLGCILLLIALTKIFGNSTSAPQRTRKGISIMMWCFIFSGLSVLLAPQISALYFTAMAIPLSVFYSFYFINAKRYWIAEILALLFGGTLITNLIIHYI